MAKKKKPYIREYIPSGQLRPMRRLASLPGEVDTLASNMATQLAGKASVTHSHPESEVTNLASDLAGKAASTHNHAESDITGLVADLASKAAASHTHAESQITNLVSDLAGKAPLVHAHPISDVTGLQAALDAKANAALFGAPVTRTITFATAYQASTNTKPAIVTVIVELATTVSIGSPQANTVEFITGSTNGVATGTGTLTDTYRSDLSVTLISLGFTGRQKLVAFLPIGYYFAVRRTIGTGISIVSCFDQAIG